MSIDINEDVKKYEKYLSLNKLREVVKMPVSLSPEEITATIPSIIMGTDGPAIDSLFLITPHYLCEIDLQVQGKVEKFDFLRLDSIANYRFELSDLVVKGADKIETSYKLVTISLDHKFPLQFRTRINYVGLDRDGWIKTVMNAIPISVMT